MKIAVVAPCPVPYVVGGAEKLWWGLVTHINERTNHQADIIKLPSPEGDLHCLLASYQQFTRLDLSGFDLVVSGKYPAWMVDHPRHVCYMLHRLRGLYDAYPGAAELPRETAADPRVAALYAYMARTCGARSALPEFFERAREVLACTAALPGIEDFPGPFARDAIRWLDDIGLSPDAIERYSAISQTVVSRTGYFPDGVDVHVVWPPPHSPREPSPRRDYFLTVSRLDTPKRVDLIVSAMHHVSADIPLWIAGTGPEEARLKVLAAGDPRIRFLGFRSDREIAELYACALAVPFVPYREDYGLIAVEAMQAGKPVLTTHDAGGPCELVVDGKTGIVCDAEPSVIGAALQRLACDIPLCERLGEAGRQRALAISWDAVVGTLLPDESEGPPTRRRKSQGKKLVLASTFGIYPPRHGGQSRIFNFYRNLAPEYETTIVSFGDFGSRALDLEIAPGVREIRIPKSAEHEQREQAISQEVGIPVTDVMMPELWRLTPEYERALEGALNDADAAIVSHPYLYPALADRGVPLWYEAHNLEWSLKKGILGQSDAGKRLLAAVHDVESAAAHAAEVVLYAASSDADDLFTIYGVDPSRMIAAPNGTDCSRISFADHAAREQLKAQLGLADITLALFIGSGHWPNIEAVKRIFEFAGEMPGIAFIIAGSVCYAFSPALKPENVLFLGEVDDVTRNLMLELCDVALNPMEYGSGTNLKMLDFFASGIPVVATRTGVRGIGVEDGRDCLIADLAEFPGAIRQVLALTMVEWEAMTRAARALVEANFDWQRIAANVRDELEKLRQRNAGIPTAA